MQPSMSEDNSPKLALEQPQLGWTNMTSVGLLEGRVNALSPGHLAGGAPAGPGRLEADMMASVPHTAKPSHTSGMAGFKLRCVGDGAFMRCTVRA
jgi:hypothetical protein